MAAYKLIYFPCRARAELIRLIFAQAGVEYENERLACIPGSAEWEAKKKGEPFTVLFISIAVYSTLQYVIYNNYYYYAQ